MLLTLLFFAGLLGCSKAPLDRQDLEVTAAGAQMEGLWVLQIRRQRWQPRDLEFVLRIEPDGDGVKGTATVDPVFIGRTTATMSEFAAEDDRVSFTLISKQDDKVYRFDAHRSGATLDGEVRWHDGKRQQVEPFSGFSRQVRRFDVDIGRFQVESAPLAVGVQPVLLDRLVLGAERARSDSILVLSDGKLVAARTFGIKDDASGVGLLDDDLVGLAQTQDEGVESTTLAPSGLAAVGQALLDEGHWTGEPAVSDRLMTALGTPTAPDTNFAESAWTYWPHPWDRSKPPIGFGHITSAGEGLLVYPEADLVVVRTLQRSENPYDYRYNGRAQMEWLQQMAETIAVDKSSEQ